MKAAWDRFRLWAWTVLIALDQLAHVLIAGPKFITLGGDCPNADETVSSIVGRRAEAGKRWALICERLIDGVFGRGHCRANIGR